MLFLERSDWWTEALLQEKQGFRPTHPSVRLAVLVMRPQSRQRRERFADFVVHRAQPGR